MAAAFPATAAPGSDACFGAWLAAGFDGRNSLGCAKKSEHNGMCRQPEHGRIYGGWPVGTGMGS
uniref:Uncharacterized protein n=1 Tax=Picea glauca TaxID=3330 RepID=A0A101LVG8_PICGL|nr:hypothetical protein ABT39_MTgene1915 [Picea glauca]